jgi:hypothetical protein
MNFLQRMEAGQRIAARLGAGQIDRATAEVELFLAWDGTVAATDGTVQRFLDNHQTAPEGSRP